MTPSRIDALIAVAVVNSKIDPPLSDDVVLNIDTSCFDVGTGDIIERLRAMVIELRQRCNILKAIISESVPVYADSEPLTSNLDEVVSDLIIWLRSLPDTGFLLDEIALKVSRKTAPGTKIIDAKLLSDLIVFAERYEQIAKAKKVLEP